MNRAQLISSVDLGLYIFSKGLLSAFRYLGPFSSVCPFSLFCRFRFLPILKLKIYSIHKTVQLFERPIFHI
jgi:hypothetical protein